MVSDEVMKFRNAMRDKHLKIEAETVAWCLSLSFSLWVWYSGWVHSRGWPRYFFSAQLRPATNQHADTHIPAHT